MEKINFAEQVDAIIKGDPRYERDAYQFVREGLDFTLKLLKKQGDTAHRHVSGQELLEGLRQFSLQQYGPMAKTVLNYWGVNQCEDFAEIVFNMVERGILGKTEQDSRNDFKGGYDFDEAFVKPYLPPPRAHVRGSSVMTNAQTPGRSHSRPTGKEKLSSGSS